MADTTLDDTENWNIADKYTSLMIMKPMYEWSNVFNYALYGAETLKDSLILPMEFKTSSRVMALDWVFSKIQEIIDNTLFAVKVEDGKALSKIEEDLEKLSERKRKAFSYYDDDVRGVKTLVINEEEFLYLLDQLRKLRRGLNQPLNHSNLIFRATAELDLDKIKKGLIEDG